MWNLIASITNILSIYHIDDISYSRPVKLFWLRISIKHTFHYKDAENTMDQNTNITVPLNHLCQLLSLLLQTADHPLSYTPDVYTTLNVKRHMALYKYVLIDWLIDWCCNSFWGLVCVRVKFVFLGRGMDIKKFCAHAINDITNDTYGWNTHGFLQPAPLPWWLTVSQLLILILFVFVCITTFSYCSIGLFFFWRSVHVK